MKKNIIYTIGYTLCREKEVNRIDVNMLFDCMKKIGVQFLIDVRTVTFSKIYQECNPHNMKEQGKQYGVKYMSIPELGAKKSNQEVFSKAKDIFFEDIFPIAKNNRPEKEILNAFDEIVDFTKIYHDKEFNSGLERIKKACYKGYTLCLMCTEKDPMDCHRFFLISYALEQRWGNLLEIRHITGIGNNNITTINNQRLKQQLEEYVRSKPKFANIGQVSLFSGCALEKYNGVTLQDKLDDFCNRYLNILHGWKKI